MNYIQLDNYNYDRVDKDWGESVNILIIIYHSESFERSEKNISNIDNKNTSIQRNKVRIFPYFENSYKEIISI